MYLYIVAVPTFSPTWANTVLTELVSASVSEIEPNCSPPAFESGTPSMLIGELPLITELGVNFPVSSAAVAVTTLKVEPGA